MKEQRIQGVKEQRIKGIEDQREAKIRGFEG